MILTDKDINRMLPIMEKMKDLLYYKISRNFFIETIGKSWWNISNKLKFLIWERVVNTIYFDVYWKIRN
jgi:hypothetical protein